MFTITTANTSSANSGRSQVIAKGYGRQRTVSVDQSRSVEANHAAAAGALLNVLADDVQVAKVLHPSGGQRVRVESVSDAGGKYRWTVNV